MDLHCSRSFGPAALAQEILDLDMETLVVEHEQDLVAYAQLHRGPAPPCVRGAATGAAPIELHRLYVLESWHGSGVAAALLDAVMERAAAVGTDVLWLGVWERNPRAIRFYDKCGFREIGDQVFVLGTDPQRDLVMARSIEKRRQEIL